MEKILDEALSALRLSYTLLSTSANRLLANEMEGKPNASFEAMLRTEAAFLCFLKLTA